MQQNEDAHLRHVFIDELPEGCASDEFLTKVRELWPEDQPDTPSPAVIISIFHWLLSENKHGRNHITDRVHTVLTDIAHSSFAENELSPEQVSQLHIDAGFVLVDGVFELP